MSHQTPTPSIGRKLLLGTALVAVLAGGIGGTASSLFTGPSQARAEAISVPNQPPLSFANVVEKVTPAVVSIKVKIRDNDDENTSDNGGDQNPFRDLPPGSPLEQFFRHFGMPNQGNDGDHPNIIQAQGSGFFISADGYAVTNNHVVDKATDVNVVLEDGTELKAKVIGTDPKTDLALVKVDAPSRTFPYVAFSNADVRVGDWVVAVGNPFGLGGSVTAGIISAHHRDIQAGPYDDFLQIDAPINKGNSGGPTFDLSGQVIGVNTMILSPSGGSIGLGFAIPSQVAQKVIQEIKDHGKVTRGWLGVQIQPISREIADSLNLTKTDGALVNEVQPHSPAEKAGFKSGDAVLSVNGAVVESPKDLSRIIAGYSPNTDVKVSIWRDGKPMDLTVTIGTLPATSDVASRAEAPDAPGKLERYGFSAQSAAKAGAGDKGVVVTEVESSGIAADKGLRQGDVILEAGGRPVNNVHELEAALKDAGKEGRKAVLLRVKADDQIRYIALAVNPQ